MRIRRSWGKALSLALRLGVEPGLRPVKELKAFGRVELAAGEAKRVTFTVPTDMLAFTGPEMIRIVEPGSIDLMIGASSVDIRLRASVQLTGDTHPIGREWRLESTFIAK